jgi:hypothetical protein
MTPQSLEAKAVIVRLGDTLEAMVLAVVVLLWAARQAVLAATMAVEQAANA